MMVNFLMRFCGDKVRVTICDPDQNVEAIHEMRCAKVEDRCRIYEICRNALEIGQTVRIEPLTE